MRSAHDDSPRALGLVAVGSAVAAIALGVAARAGMTHVVDTRAERRMPRGRGRVGHVMNALTVLGEPVVQLPLAVALGAALRAGAGRETRWAAAAPVIAGGLAVGVHHGVKRLYPRRRPLSARLQGKREPSYPSGHAAVANAVSLATYQVVARRMRRDPTGRLLAGIAAAALPTLVGASRMYARRHWLSDVVGGWLTGAALAAATVAACELLDESPRQGPPRSTMRPSL